MFVVLYHFYFLKTLWNTEINIVLRVPKVKETVKELTKLVMIELIFKVLNKK